MAIGKYSGEALVTMEKIMNGQNSYRPNEVYKNTIYNFHWYINQNGYMHVLRPIRTTLNGVFQHYSIEDSLLTKNNMLKQSAIIGNYITVDEVIQAIEQEETVNV